MPLLDDTLAPAAVAPHLAGRFGHPYLYAPSCSSTQLLLDGEQHDEGTVAATDHQTAGRGRLGRTWDAPPRTSVLCSIVLKPPAGRHLPELTIVGALAVADAVERATDLAVQVKWPNDVMLNRRKVAGILADLRGGAVVLGVGVNVNQAHDELPEGAPTPPGSLRSVVGHRFDRAALLGSMLAALERDYDAWCGSGLTALYGALGSRDFLRGRRITTDAGPATAVLVRPDGRLEVVDDSGAMRLLESGEVLTR